MLNKDENNQKELIEPLPPRSKSRRMGIVKIILEFLVLVFLISAALISGIFPFAAKAISCGQLPYEASEFAYESPETGNGLHYAFPGTKGYTYGIRDGTNYYCTYNEMALAWQNFQTSDVYKKARIADQLSKVDYTLFVPQRLLRSDFQFSGSNNIQTEFDITSINSIRFGVKEVKKGTAYDDANSCNMPEQKYTYGKVINKVQGRDVCLTVRKPGSPDLGQYTQYVVGVDIGQTGVVLSANYDSKGSDNAELLDLFNREAMDVFSNMVTYVK